MIDLRKHAIALHFVKPGDAVIDAGAFIGSYSFLYRKMVGSRGLVFAYEAQPRAADMFKAKVQTKKIRNIIVREKAVSSTNGEKLAMKVYADKMEQSCTVEPLLMNEERMPGNTIVVKVETEKLDTLKNRLGGRALSFIKIDTEGHESQVIEGAAELIVQHQPFIVMEYGFIPGSFEPTTLFQLQELGYTCFDLRTMQKVLPGYVSLLPTDLVGVPKTQVEVFLQFFSSLPSNPILLKGIVYYTFLKTWIRTLLEFCFETVRKKGQTFPQCNDRSDP